MTSEVTCPQCGEPIAADDVNLEAAVARCLDCGTVFNLTETAPSGDASSGSNNDWVTPGSGAADSADGDTAAEERDRSVPMPDAISVDRTAGGLHIERRWFHWYHVFLAFFCLFWNGFLCNWYGMALGSDAPTSTFVFPLLHVGVGVGLTYYTATGLLNTTTIHVADERLTVDHGPLPWYPTHDLATDQLDQLFCVETNSWHRNRRIQYELRAAMVDGRELKLLSGLHDETQALFIEQEIEAHLGIADREVTGF